MDRVAVVGPGGAGKSTFARQLGDRTGMPVVHLDHYFWQPGWVETPEDAWPQRQAALLAGDRWIADGNYGRTFDVRFERADTVIVISPSRWACVAGALSRSIRNRGAEVQAEGCPERIKYSFYRWIWSYNRDSRPRLDAAIGRHDHLQIFELTSRTAIRKFLDSVTVAHET
jgi:adenylate kinase family enzyme